MSTNILSELFIEMENRIYDFTGLGLPRGDPYSFKYCRNHPIVAEELLFDYERRRILQSTSIEIAQQVYL